MTCVIPFVYSFYLEAHSSITTSTRAECAGIALVIICGCCMCSDRVSRKKKKKKNYKNSKKQATKQKNK